MISFKISTCDILGEKQHPLYDTLIEDNSDQDPLTYQMFYIEEAERTIACAILDKKPNVLGIYKLHVFEVSEEHRKKGIGRYLIEHVVKELKEIYLDSLTESLGFWLKVSAKPLIRTFVCDVFLFSERPVEEVRNLMFNPNLHPEPILYCTRHDGTIIRDLSSNNPVM